MEQPHRTPSSSKLRSLRACLRGGVSAEYLMVVAACGLTLVLTLAALGPQMVLSWSYSRHVLYGRAP
jgi:hypothetical protein